MKCHHPMLTSYRLLWSDFRQMFQLSSSHLHNVSATDIDSETICYRIISLSLLWLTKYTYLLSLEILLEANFANWRDHCLTDWGNLLQRCPLCSWQQHAPSKWLWIWNALQGTLFNAAIGLLPRWWAIDQLELKQGTHITTSVYWNAPSLHQ